MRSAFFSNSHVYYRFIVSAQSARFIVVARAARFWDCHAKREQARQRQRRPKLRSFFRLIRAGRGSGLLSYQTEKSAR